jgi:predicted amidohydrolase YtcJ
MMRSRLLVFFAMLVAPSLAAPVRAQQLPDLVVRWADLVLHNGQIQTVDRDDPKWTVARAVAIRDGKILAVGVDADMLALAGPQTVRIDLKGRTVMPGFIDTHSHLPDYANVPPPVAAKYGRISATGDMKQRDRALQQIADFAKTYPEGQWIDVSTSQPMLRSFTLEEMDRVAPKHPLYVGGSPSYGAMNSRGFEEVLKYYPDVDGIMVDAQGKRTGQLETPIMGIVTQEFLPALPLEIKVAAYKAIMDRFAGAGITTFSSSVRTGGKQLTGMVEVERRGMMTMRFGFSHGWLMDNPLYHSYVRRIGDMAGVGTDYIWNTGVSTISIDGSLGSNCVSMPMKKLPAGQSDPRGDCRALPGMPRYEAIKDALSNNIRISGIHAAGDRSVGAMLDLFLELKAKGINVQQLRPNLDHCVMLSGDNVQKAAQVPGMMFSCAPKYIIGGSATRASDLWDTEVANNWVMPIKGLMDAGVKVVWEVDSGGSVSGGDSDEPDGEAGYPIFQPMLQMQSLLTRETADGKVWGARHAIDRHKALLMMTRHGAGYVLREDRLGSIEAGKLADLAIFDGDWAKTPDKQLMDLANIMTIVGGQVVYADPTFAQEVGSQLDRVKHKFAASYPAYRPTPDMLKWRTRSGSGQ